MTMELIGSKTHPEFDLNAAKALFDILNEELAGEQISSPFDLYSVETLRDVHGLRIGEALATDVFVLGKGAPPRLDVTRVSGIPYWPKSKQWPVAPDGSPYQFLAQFNFTDSFDITGPLPGDILQLYVPMNEDEWIWDGEVHFEWLHSGEADLTDRLPDGVPQYCPGEWYGVISRTYDYPYAFSLSDELGVSQAYNLPIINGTKIGGMPCNLQEEEIEIDDTRFLCQLASIQAAPGVPYPWTNRREPFDLSFDQHGIHGEANEYCFGDMGVIYIVIDRNGDCSLSGQCY